MKRVRVRFTQRVYWDNWGRMVTAFRAGDVVEAEDLHDTGVLSAKSPYWEGVTDIIYPEQYEVLPEEDWNPDVDDNGRPVAKCPECGFDAHLRGTDTAHWKCSSSICGHTSLRVS